MLDGQGLEVGGDRLTVSIKNWRRYQHYTKRHPPWIKLYHELLDDRDFARLDPFSQLIYFKLLMVSARKNNVIPRGSAYLSTELSLPRAKVKRAVDALIQAGFLEPCASNLASNVASGNALAELETELDPLYPPHTTTVDNLACNIAGCGIQFKTALKLRDHLRNVHWREVA